MLANGGRLRGELAVAQARWLCKPGESIDLVLEIASVVALCCAACVRTEGPDRRVVIPIAHAVLSHPRRAGVIALVRRTHPEARLVEMRCSHCLRLRHRF